MQELNNNLLRADWDRGLEYIAGFLEDRYPRSRDRIGRAFIDYMQGRMRAMNDALRYGSTWGSRADPAPGLPPSGGGGGGGGGSSGNDGNRASGGPGQEQPDAGSSSDPATSSIGTDSDNPQGGPAESVDSASGIETDELSWLDGRAHLLNVFVTELGTYQMLSA